MATSDTDADRIAELEAELQQRDDKLKELTHERDEALELAARERQQVEDGHELIDSWIEVFEMQQDDSGNWIWDPNQSELWDKHLALLDDRNKLIARWNKFVPEYNQTVRPRERGRPLAASEAQQAEVLKQRKRGMSLRTIATATGLSLRTVCTITARPDKRRDRVSKRTNELRRRELDRRRAAAFRTRHRARDQLPEKIAEVLKTGAALIKEAKGLGR